MRGGLVIEGFMHFLLTGYFASSKIGDCPYFPYFLFSVPIFSYFLIFSIFSGTAARQIPEVADGAPRQLLGPAGGSVYATGATSTVA